MKKPFHPEDSGTVLPVVLVLAVVCGGVVTTFLGRSVVEQKRVAGEVSQQNAYWRAFGQMELARQKIARSLYIGGKNDVLQQALQSQPPVVDGTGVWVEQIPNTKWHRLTSVGNFRERAAAVQSFVREGTSYVAYNYYVEDMSLGVSGQPEGRIHTNDKLQFYFSGGRFTGLVSAVNGFEYKNGAAPSNTALLGGTDPAATEKALLDSIDFADLESQAILVGAPGLIGEVQLQGATLDVELHEPNYQDTYTKTWNEQVYIGDVWQEITEDIYIGDAMVPRQVARYRTEMQLQNVVKSRQVWIEYDGSGGGTDVAGGGAATGYWATEYYTEQELVAVSVFDYWDTVMVSEPQYDTVTRWDWVPQYETVQHSEERTKWFTGAKVHDVDYPADGLFYFNGEIREVRGDINGHVTLVTEKWAEIDSSIRYVDSAGETAYLNGNTNAQPYVPNPNFKRDHSFALVAQGAILYDRYVPSYFELNGSLISTNETISYEGIAFNNDGEAYRQSSAKVRESFRRFGAIMCAWRPVATLLNSDGKVQHGFKTGASIYDQGLLNSPPPGAPDSDAPMFRTTYRMDGSVDISAEKVNQGNSLPSGMTTLDNLLSVAQIKEGLGGASMDWGQASTASTY